MSDKMPPPALPRRPVRPPDDLPPAAIATCAVLGAVALAFALTWAVPRAIDWAQAQDWHQLIEWARTISEPVHDYLAAHTTGLPVTPATAYTLWQSIGLASLAAGFLTRATGARLTWLAHGIATAAMVWAQAPAAGRWVATGLTVLAWTAASTLALRGLRR
ncbi:hypothetical protein [Streptomyces sp. NPDC059788]|uniref:hypothetical protein n=1 Tax=Streptomyces sp. NPDC059788 TaxID=3346948 RepID=UPI0036493A2C